MSELKIGPVTYDVKLVDEFVDMDDEDYDPKQLGNMDLNTHTIKVRRGLKAPVHAITLWHEVLHVLAFQSGHTVKEGVIEALSYGIYQVIRDNEDLVTMTERIAE